MDKSKRFFITCCVLSLALVFTGCASSVKAPTLTLDAAIVPYETSTTGQVTYSEATGHDQVVLAEVFTYDE